MGHRLVTGTKGVATDQHGPASPEPKRLSTDDTDFHRFCRGELPDICVNLWMCLFIPKIRAACADCCKTKKLKQKEAEGAEPVQGANSAPPATSCSKVFGSGTARPCFSRTTNIDFTRSPRGFCAKGRFYRRSQRSQRDGLISSFAALCALLFNLSSSLVMAKSRPEDCTAGPSQTVAQWHP